MELLRQRRTWEVVGLLAAAGVVGWLYWLPPRPSAFNWLIDAAAFALMFFGGLAIISQFVLPVQTMEERERVLRHFIDYVLGSHGPIIFVKEGKIVGRQEELKKYGQGVALLDSSSAIVLERTYASSWWRPAPRGGVPLVRAAGPGVVFIQPGERIVETLDLRRQSRSTPAKALTRDGIEVTANIGVVFGLSREPPASSQVSGDQALPVERRDRNKPARLFEPERAFRAVYGAALGEKQPVGWTELPVAVAVETFRNLLAEYTLDSLFQPTAHSVYPFGDFQARAAAAVKEAHVLEERGLIVFNVSVGGLKLPREVVNQRVRSWQARWQKAVIQNVASGKRQQIVTQGRWQVSAQETILENMKERLEAAKSPAEKRALAVLLINVLQRAASEPATRQLLSKESLKTLESASDWLK
jgi:regulator of protease activity HflC (stomatin/prohibitin superfamily)